MDLGALIDAIEKEVKLDNPRASTGNIKKADLLFQLKLELDSSQQDISKYSQSLETVLLYLAGQPASSPLRRLLKSTLKSFLTKSKPIKTQTVLIELLKLAQSLKLTLNSKLTSIDTIGFLYSQFSSKLVSPPNDELLESCKKIFKSLDFLGKKVILKALNSVIMSKPTNFPLSSSEYLKFYLKSASEKNTETRNLCSKGLLYLSSYYPQIFIGQFENCIQACLKMMEDNNSLHPGKVLGEILSINIDTSLQGHSFTNQRKSLDQFPKTVNDLNYLITQYISRLSSHEARIGLIIAAITVYQKHLKKSLPSQTEIGSFFESFVLIGQRISSNESECWWSSEVIAYLGKQAFSYLSQSQAKILFDLIKGKLAGITTMVCGEFGSEADGLKFSSEYLVIIYLKLIICIVERNDETVLDIKDLEKTFISLLKIPRVQVQVCWTLEYLIKKNSSFLLPFLSTMVTNTTIAYAELECLRSQSYSKDSLHHIINNLIGNCYCLSTLIKNLNGLDRGIPVEETEITFNTIKNLVSSEYQGDIIEEEKMFCSDPGLQEIDNAKRHAAWILVDGLMHLGPIWVGSRLNFLFKMWKLPFGRKTCILEQVSSFWIISEVTHKKVASSAMLNFMKNNKSLLHPQIHKLLIVYLSNALQFLSPTKNSTQHRQFLEQNCQSGILTDLKRNLYECLLLLPSTTIATKINLILNPIYSELVSDKNNTQIFFSYSGKNGKRSSGMMELAESWLSSEDLYLHNTKPPHYLHSLSLVGYEGYYDSWECKVDHQPLFSEMLSTAVKLFSEIFANSALNVSNRQKLFTFISQHLTTSVKNKENSGKFNKICTILLAVHGCLMKLSSIRGVITDSVLTKCIKSMLSSVESFSHPLAKCLFSESMIYLCKVMSEPQYIPVFMKEIEHRIILSETTPNIKSGIVMQVGNMYKHFDINLLEKNQDSLGHIIQSISRDENVGAWALQALLKAYSTHKNKVEYIFKATFPLGYHLYLNEHPAEFKFSDTMLLLCCKYMESNFNTSDSFYVRAKFIWQDTWKKSNLAYSCALLLSQIPDFNLQEIIEFAMEKIPEYEALNFLAQCKSIEISEKKNIFEWFKLYDQSENPESRSCIMNILQKSLKPDFETFKKLKLIILSAEKEQEEENKGLAAFNDRENSGQFVDFFNLHSKTEASELVISLIKSAPKHFESSIEELINFAIHLTSFSYSLSSIGLELAITLFKTYHGLIDPDDPEHKYLEIFEAQVSATIRENLDSEYIELCFKSCKLLNQFLQVPGTRDLEVVNRLVKNLVGLLNCRNKDGYTEARSTELYVCRLYLIAKSLLKAPEFIKEIIKKYEVELMEHFIILLKDMCVLFTQSKNTLKDHKFILGKHNSNYDQVKMASIEVFIRAALVMNPNHDLEFFISNIFVFLFLPYSASREQLNFSSQREINRCLHRREEILKALNSIVHLISNEKIIAELVVCLEFCEQIPSIAHKVLILQICRNIKVIKFEDLEKLEKLVKKILSCHEEVREECWETWGWVAFEYSLMYLDKKIEKSVAFDSILGFFIQVVNNNHQLAFKVLDSLLELNNIQDLQMTLSEKVMEQLWDQDQVEVTLEYISTKPLEKFHFFSFILKTILESLKKIDSKALKILLFLNKKPSSLWLYQYCLPTILQIFHMRKSNFLPHELSYLTETIKLLMNLYLKAADKAKVISAIFPLFLSLYHQVYPVSIIKAVSKALSYISANSTEAFQKVLSGLNEVEKKFVESQLETQTFVATKTVAQPSITLSLKFKKN